MIKKIFVAKLNYKVVLIFFVCFYTNLFSQVITHRGNSEWIEQQRKIFARNYAVKHNVSKDILDTKISNLVNNIDFTAIIGVDIEVSIDFFELTKVENINDTLDIAIAK